MSEKTSSTGSKDASASCFSHTLNTGILYAVTHSLVPDCIHKDDDVIAGDIE